METRWKSCSDMLYLWCLNKLMHHQFGKFIHTSASHTCYQPRAWTWLGRTPSPAPITESDLVYHTGRHETQPSCGFTSSQNPYILHINSKSATPVVFKANYVWKPETQFTYHPKIFARPLELLESLVVYVSGWHVRHVRAVRSLSDTMDHMFKRCPVSSLHDWMKIMTHMHAYAQVCSQQTVWMPDMPGSVCYSFKTNTATFMHECGTKNQSNNIELIASKACNMTLVIRASSHIHSEFSFSTWNPPNDAICRPRGKPTDKKHTVIEHVLPSSRHLLMQHHYPKRLPSHHSRPVNGDKCWNGVTKHNGRWCQRTAPRPCSCRAHVLDDSSFNLKCPNDEEKQCGNDIVLGFVWCLQCFLSHLAQQRHNKIKWKHHTCRIPLGMFGTYLLSWNPACLLGYRHLKYIEMQSWVQS